MCVHNVYCRYWRVIILLSFLFSASSVPQNTKEGENKSYAVSGFWDVGVPFLAPLNEETPKCERTLLLPFLLLVALTSKPSTVASSEQLCM